MGAPVLLLQIVDLEGRVIQLPGGGALETDLVQSCAESILSLGAVEVEAACTAALRAGLTTAIDQCTNAITSRGIGVLRTEAHVQQAIRDGLQEVLAADLLLRVQIRHRVDGSFGEGNVREIVALGLRAAIQRLKDQTRAVV